MINKLRDELLIEWIRCDRHKQKKIAKEYLELCEGYYSQEGFLHFLKDNLRVEGLKNNSRLP